MEKQPDEIKHAIATEKELIEQTEKWLTKIKAVNLIPLTKKGEWMKTNIEAYISDAQDFLKKKDYVRSFEAVIWAWGFFELGLEFEQLKKQ